MDTSDANVNHIFKREEENNFVDKLKDLKIISPIHGFVHRSGKKKLPEEANTSYLSQLIRGRTVSIDDKRFEPKINR